MSNTVKLWIALLALGSIGLVAGCGDDNKDGGTPTGPDLNRTYVQIERLGNPLVSEVTLAKRTHGAHNAVGPASDTALFADELKTFVTSFGRPQALADLLATVLLPDELIVDTSKAATPAGWLTWALADGYGGRLLTDDVVDTGLSAIFGTAVNDQNPLPARYHSDNVPASTQTFNLSTFPYLGNTNLP
jgi:hypothetical protein